MPHWVSHLSSVALIHLALIGCICCSFSEKRKQKPPLFRETCTLIKEPSKTTLQIQTPTKANSRTASITQKPTPQIPTPKPSPPPKPTSNPSKDLSLAKRQKLADLAQQLGKHCETPTLDWQPQPIQPLETASSNATHTDNLCQLLQAYVTLPFTGEVRVYISLNSQGEIMECRFLSSLSEANKQTILSAIQKTPFQKFFKQHKVSKNIAFTVKLVGQGS